MTYLNKQRRITNCQGINLKDGTPCKLPVMSGSDTWCNMHNPDLKNERIIRARKGARAPRTIVAKLAEFRINDTLDMNVAIKKIIEDILRNGRLNTTSDINIFNGLVKTAIVLEQNAEIPKKLREIEALMQSREKAIVD